MPATINTQHYKTRGFSLFELVVVILLIGVFMTIAIDNLLRLQIDAARVSVQHVIGSLNSAVNLEAADRILKQGLGSIKSLENSNPMDYLSELPFNYIGVRSDLAAATSANASWYFDPDAKILVYKVRNRKYFNSELDGTPRIRFKVALVYRNNIANGPISAIQGVHLKSLDNYSWITEDL